MDACSLLPPREYAFQALAKIQRGTRSLLYSLALRGRGKRCHLSRILTRPLTSMGSRTHVFSLQMCNHPGIVYKAARIPWLMREFLPRSQFQLKLENGPALTTMVRVSLVRPQCRFLMSN
jgi:hypothetical protein